MTRLMDQLGEQEVLRNEALLLLTQLAGGSADLQKIAAFEGGLERLLGIIRWGATGWRGCACGAAPGWQGRRDGYWARRLLALSAHTAATPTRAPLHTCREEGGLDGDIVVQDCFQLLAALLRGSTPNQLMFRETGLLAQLPAMLRLPDEAPGGGGAAAAHVARLGGGAISLMGAAGLDSGMSAGPERRQLAPQKAANLVAAMEVVLALLPPAAAPPTAPVCASAAENRQALLHRGLLDVLVDLALQGGGVADDSVRAQALLCLAALVGGSRVQQDQLAALAVKWGGHESVPLLQVRMPGCAG